jgi:predicted MFS family arabinose efflux permease
MDGVGNYEGWRWIFILEGVFTVLVAIGAFFLMHDFPETASFLTPEERAWASHVSPSLFLLASIYERSKKNLRIYSV